MKIIGSKNSRKAFKNFACLSTRSVRYNGSWILLLVCVLLIALSSIGSAQVTAFPTAEGYGKYTIGGRGGKVYEVTNLNDSGEGSLRAAVEASGPRTVVFRVSGTIVLDSVLSIKNPYITIAGQTAPGDGICLRKYQLSIDANEVIVRYLRVRPGNEAKGRSDAVSSRYVKNIIIDHVSASWSGDEVMSVYHCENVTVQWCLVAESIGGGAHRFAAIWGSNNSSYHHNLIAHHIGRNPRFASGCGNTDYRNNVLYNWGSSSSYGGEREQPGKPQFNFSNVNMVANYYKPGPATNPSEASHCIVSPWTRDGAAGYGKWYVADNFVEGNAAVSANNWNGGVQPQGGSSDIAGLKLDKPWPAMAISQQTAKEAYSSVLKNAGATLPKRDSLDARIVEEARSGNATYEGSTYKQKYPMPDKSKKCGIIDSQADVGGWPELKSTPAPTDTDHDGMPDEWEIAQGLDPKNAADGNKVAADGYTMLEKYLNSIVSSAPVKKAQKAGKSDSAVKIPPMSAHFPLDEGKGTVVTEVISGTKGELINADTAVSWISGKLGGALRLDGTDDRIFVSHNPASALPKPTSSAITTPISKAAVSGPQS